MAAMLDGKEVAKHNSADSCWVIIKGQVYDVTSFLNDHPGGPNVILRLAGKDATEEYEPIHPPGTIEEGLPQEKHLGAVDPATVPREEHAQAIAKKLDPKHAPPLSTVINLHDFQKISERFLSAKAWAYYSSSADDTITLSDNQTYWSRILFRPRVFRDVSNIDMTTLFLGVPSALPFFIAPAALARLAHPDGEACLTRAAGMNNIVQAVSTNASMSVEQIAKARISDSQPLFFQFYVHTSRSKARDLLSRVEKTNAYKALLVTVDSAVPGKREADERLKAGLNDMPGSKSVAASLMGTLSADLTWDDIRWMRKQTKMPIVAKGIMTAEDAYLAYKNGLEGIILSNHGGRQLDTSPPSILTLLEIRKTCPEIINKLEIYLDGGIRRGSDVVKALCLGAKGCALGRPFLYSICSYGTEGACHAIAILADEIKRSMALCGASKLSDLTPSMVNTRAIDSLVADADMSLVKPRLFRL